MRDKGSKEAGNEIIEPRFPAGGSLNPDWVAWLMGWPIGWESLEPITELQWFDWQEEPDIPRVANSVKNRVDRLKCLGNGQVPACAALAWKILSR